MCISVNRDSKKKKIIIIITEAEIPSLFIILLIGTLHLVRLTKKYSFFFFFHRLYEGKFRRDFKNNQIIFGIFFPQIFPSLQLLQGALIKNTFTKMCQMKVLRKTISLRASKERMSTAF